MELRKERRNQAVTEGWVSTNYFSRKNERNDGIALAALHTCYTAMLQQISVPTQSHFTCKVVTLSRSLKGTLVCLILKVVQSKKKTFPSHILPQR